MAQNAAITVVVVAITIIVGLIIFASTYNAMLPTLGSINSTQLNATVANVNTTTYNAFTLLVISLIVLAAVAILGYVFLLRGR